MEIPKYFTMSCIKILINFQTELRLHHWGTESYSAHKALGKLYEGLDGLIDTFVESYIGVYGKEEIKEVNAIQLNGPYKTHASAVVNSLEDYLMNELPNELDENQTALLNIRDEMLGLVQQTKYLLTLS
jgi:DNA-binding ferritin-like protein